MRLWCDIMRIFITTPAVKAGSTVLSWLLSRHSYLNHSPIMENIELGAMLNVLDHVPGWIKRLGPDAQSAGKPEMVERIRGFSDSIINPHGREFSAIKFTNFQSYNWLSHVFPDGKTIVIARDLHDWYASIKIWNTTRHGTWNIANVDRWITMAAHSLRERPDIGIVRFEDLVERTDETLTAVHGYLGIPPEPPDVSGQEEIFKSFSSMPSTFLAPTGSKGLLSPSPLGRGQQLLQSERDHVSRIMDMQLVRSTIYSDDRRIR